MILEIITPQQMVFSGEVTLVTLPGVVGSFTVLENHAPIISSLSHGKIVYRTAEKEFSLTVSGGFAEVHKNRLSVCVESVENE